MLNICGFMLSPGSNKVLMSTHWTGIEQHYLHLSTTCGDQHQQFNIVSDGPGHVSAHQAPSQGYQCEASWLEALANQDNATLTPDDVIAHIQPDQWLDWVTIHANNKLASIMFNIYSVTEPTETVPFQGNNSLERNEGLERNDGLERNEGPERHEYPERPDYLYESLLMLDRHLSGGGYLGGEHFSYADLNLLSILDPEQLARTDLTAYPHVLAWQDALKAQQFELTVHRFSGLQSASPEVLAGGSLQA